MMMRSVETASEAITGCEQDSLKYDAAFFASFEADMKEMQKEMALADLALYGLVGVFFTGLGVLAIYVMFAFPQTGMTGF